MTDDPTMREVKRGAIAAVRGCGPWPTAGTLPEYLAAAERAQLEMDRAIETWQRWRRRFDPSGDRLELGSERTNVRIAVAKVEYLHRDEAVRQLLGPVSGSA